MVKCTYKPEFTFGVHNGVCAGDKRASKFRKREIKMKTHNLSRLLHFINLRKHTKPAVLCVSTLLILSMLSAFSSAAGQAATATTALHVKGNQVFTANGTPLVLKGMDYFNFAYSANGSWMLPSGAIELNTWDPTAVQDTLNFMVASNCNALRLYLCVQLWLDNSNNYQGNVEYVIAQAADRGIYTDVTFYNNNATAGQPTGVLPWNDPGNNVLNSSVDFVNLWGNVSTTLKSYPYVIFELWNEPQGDEATWFNVTQQCITRIRSVGATQLINIMYSTGGAYDYGNNGVNWINENADTYAYNLAYVKEYPLSDPLGDLIYSTHLYRFSFVNSSVSAVGLTQSGVEDVYSYSDMLYALTVTDVLSVAASHPLVVFEMGYNNWAYDPANESTWFNATLTILDQNKIGYCDFAAPPPSETLQQWSLVQIYLPPNYTWTGSGAANYTLDTAGIIFVNHLGGMSYSDWLNPQHTTPQSPTPALASTSAPLPTSTDTISDISIDNVVIVASVVALVVALVIVVTSRVRVPKSIK